ncbi:MAG: hypothetical protein IJC89_04650 [Clostridia bacterium]|nr:hypothetical protein [Clostridia bacterium]
MYYHIRYSNILVVGDCMGDFPVTLSLCDECIKYNKTLEFCHRITSVCDICGRKSEMSYWAAVNDENDVANILKDFYKNEEVFNRAIQNRSCYLLYGNCSEEK